MKDVFKEAWDTLDQIVAAYEAGKSAAEKEEERTKDEAWIEAELKKNPQLTF